MMQWMIFLCPLLVLMTVSCIMLQRLHLLMALLALEAMILSMIFMIIIMTNASWNMFIIVMLTMGACEASLGLACMTAMSRSYGNDYPHSLSLNKC